MSENRKTALVLGGTGAMGQSLVPILAGCGTEVYVTSRKMRENHDRNVIYLKGNARDIVFLKTILTRKYDVIIDFMSYGSAEFADRMDMLLDAAGQYIFLSSARVYAESEEPLTESSPRLLDVCKDAGYLATDDYALAKAREEDMLLRSGRKNFTIIRPSITYSGNRLQFALGEKEEWLYRALKGRSIIFPEDMENIRTAMTYGKDVAYAISRLAGNEKAYGEIVQIASEESRTWAEILEIYQQSLEELTGRRAKVISVPDSGALAKRLGCGKYYQVKYARAVSRSFDCSKLKMLAGEALHFSSPEAGLKTCLSECLENGSFAPAGVRVSACYDKIAGEYTPLCEFASGRKKLKYLVVRYMPYLL